MTSDSESRRPVVYLAGPDIFYPDQDERYRRLEVLCSACGLQGLRPSDGDMQDTKDTQGSAPTDARELARRIYEGNVRHLSRADAVLANLEPFRNPVEPDSGTVFEVGMAVALGKPVVAYWPQAGQTLAQRVMQAFGERQARSAEGWRYDASHGLMIEDMGLPLNLMLGCSVQGWATTAEEAVRKLAALLPAHAAYLR